MAERPMMTWGGPSGAGGGGGGFTATLTPLFGLTLEIGANLISPTFNAIYSAPPTTASLADDDGNPALDVVAVGNPIVMPNPPYIYQELANSTARLWTLTADDGGVPDSSAVTARWYPRVYWDIDANPALATEADIEAMANSSLQGNKALSTTLGPVLQYVYYAFPAVFPAAPLDFQFGAFPGGFTQVVASVAVTANTPGAPTQNYEIWRSNFQLDTTISGPQPFVVAA